MEAKLDVVEVVATDPERFSSVEVHVTAVGRVGQAVHQLQFNWGRDDQPRVGDKIRVNIEIVRRESDTPSESTPA